jgi:Kef-type K+ transport system membrane component KefB/nucleotide-binding universal stress UspA family protein
MATLLCVARLLGEVCLRYGQPAVLGELGAGILLGPSILGSLSPGTSFVIPHSPAQGHLLAIISTLGSMMLLLITGMETDLQLIRRRRRAAFGVWAGGVFVPLASGFALGMVLPDQLLGDPSNRVVFSMFVAVAMSISALGVLAKMLRDLKMTRRDVGQITVAAAMVEDTTGWVLLSVVIALASDDGVGAADVLVATGKVLFFIAFGVLVGRPVLRWMMRYTQDHLRSRDRLITVVFAATLAFAAFAMSLGLEPVLGAFMTGTLFSTMPRLPKAVGHFYESVALGMLAPIFFAVAGMKVDLKSLFHPAMFGYTMAVLGVACFGKVVGTYVGARVIGKVDHWTALAMGSALNARGSMEIIIATIGLKLGILTNESFSMIVVIAPTTSLLAPPALRYCLSKVGMTAEESARLAREEQDSRNWLAGIHRVLIPIRYRPGMQQEQRAFEEAVVARLGQRGLSLTLMTVVPPGLKTLATEWLTELARGYSPHEVTIRVRLGKETVPAILDELQNDYGMMILGAPESSPDSDRLFSNVVDELVHLSPCPTLVLRRGVDTEHNEFRRILVPTNGSSASKRAATLAVSLAEGTEHHVAFLHVLVRDDDHLLMDAKSDSEQVEIEKAHRALTELVKMGEERGVACSSEIRMAEGPARAIVSLANQPGQADLVILGTDVRPGNRLYLGPRVERVLQHCRASVIVVNE